MHVCDEAVALFAVKNCFVIQLCDYAIERDEMRVRRLGAQVAANIVLLILKFELSIQIKKNV